MRILMRGAIDPLIAMAPAKYIIENHTGGNIGNMLFTHGIAKTILYSDDVKIDYIDLAKKKTDKKYADYVNETYDYFLIPLANAFKNTNHEELTKLAKFIKMLKIPCAVIGVGLQAKLNNKRFIDNYKYNDEVKEFINAVLDKSPMIGIRGEMTGDYLKDLGFLPEQHYTVIGCPSMYTFGDTLPQVKEISLNSDSVVSFNSKIEFEKNKDYKPFIEFSKRNMLEFPNMVYVQQQIDDIRMIFLDRYKTELREDKMYDISKAISFVDVPSWIDYFKENVDFSIGSRIHGNVAAVLGGVPAVTIPFDRRVYELADYHNIPIFDRKSIKETTSLYDVFNSVDFNSVQKGHKKRFEHYIDFIHSIGLDTVYDHKFKKGETPYEKFTSKQNYNGVIKSYDVCEQSEQLARYRDAFPIVKRIQENYRSKTINLEAELKLRKHTVKWFITKLKNRLKNKGQKH